MTSIKDSWAKGKRLRAKGVNPKTIVPYRCNPGQKNMSILVFFALLLYPFAFRLLPFALCL
jgi:hypothetical protein